jgi:hypothetical protein
MPWRLVRFLVGEQASRIHEGMSKLTFSLATIHGEYLERQS